MRYKKIESPERLYELLKAHKSIVFARDGFTLDDESKIHWRVFSQFSFVYVMSNICDGRLYEDMKDEGIIDRR